MRHLQSDSHYYRMFQKELIEAHEQNVDPETLGVPDIKSGGKHVVREMASDDFGGLLVDSLVCWLIRWLVRFYPQGQRKRTVVSSK